MFSEVDILLDKSNQLTNQKESSFAYHFFIDLGRTPQNEQRCGKVSRYMIIHLRLASPIPLFVPCVAFYPFSLSLSLFFSSLELLSLLMFFFCYNFATASHTHWHTLLFTMTSFNSIRSFTTGTKVSNGTSLLPPQVVKTGLQICICIPHCSCSCWLFRSSRFG